MVNESDLSRRADYLLPYQFSARDLPTPHFGRPHDVQSRNAKPIRSIAFSSDGKKIATGTELKGLRIWDAKQPIDPGLSYSLPSSSKPSPHNGHVAALAFSPVDPNVLISGCKSSSGGAVVAVWDIKHTSAAIATFKIPGDVLHLDFHPSGTQFAVVCPRQHRDEVYFYHLTDTGWKKRDDVALGGQGVDIGSEEINSLRFSNSGKLLCAVSNDGSTNAWIYPVEPQVDEPEIPSMIAPPSAPETAPTSPKEVEESKSRASTPRAETPEPENEPKEEAGEKESEGDVEMANGEVGGGDGAEGIEIAVNGETQETHGDVEMSTTADPVPAEPSETSDPSTTQPTNDPGPEPEPDGSSAPSRRPSPPPPSSTVDTPKAAAKQLKRLRHAICHSASLLALSFCPSGRWLAVGGQDALLSLMDTRDWICVRTFDVCPAAIRYCPFSSDGELIAIAGDDRNIYIVSVFSGQTVAKIAVTGVIMCIAWHPNKNWLVYSTNARTMATPVWYIAYQD